LVVRIQHRGPQAVRYAGRGWGPRRSVTRGRAAVLVLVLSFGALPALAQPAAQASGTTARPASSSGWRARGIAAFDTVWRTINETHFDPSFGGLDWGAVGRELRDRVEAATSPAEQRGI